MGKDFTRPDRTFLLLTGQSGTGSVWGPGESNE
jgi:hypothetical protein